VTAGILLAWFGMLAAGNVFAELPDTATEVEATEEQLSD